MSPTISDIGSGWALLGETASGSCPSVERLVREEIPRDGMRLVAMSGLKAEGARKWAFPKVELVRVDLGTLAPLRTRADELTRMG